MNLTHLSGNYHDIEKAYISGNIPKKALKKMPENVLLKSKVKNKKKNKKPQSHHDNFLSMKKLGFSTQAK